MELQQSEFRAEILKISVSKIKWRINYDLGTYEMMVGRVINGKSSKFWRIKSWEMKVEILWWRSRWNNGNCKVKLWAEAPMVGSFECWAENRPNAS